MRLECSITADATLGSRKALIELLFCWIKQHLKLRQFLGRSENAIRLQILAAIDKPSCFCAWPQT
jgi:IS4 transposase